MNCITDICRSLFQQGFKKILIVNGHCGNSILLQATSIKIREELGQIVGIATFFDLVKDVAIVDHAGEPETSVLMHISPDLVKKPEKPSGDQFHKFFSLKHSYVVIPMPPTNELTKVGYMGDPTEASSKKGEVLLETAANRLANYIMEVKKRGYLIGYIP